MTSFGATTPVSSRALNTAFLQLETQIAGASGSPIGSVVMWAGTTANIPTGYALCNGASLPTTGTYQSLFDVLQYRYGGSGANFNLPDFTSRVPEGITGVPTIPATDTTSASSAVDAHTHTVNTGLNLGNLNTHVHGGGVLTAGSVNSSFTAGNANNHTHGVAGNTGNASANHSHVYFKPNSGANNNTGGDGAAHTHGFSTTSTGSNTTISVNSSFSAGNTNTSITAPTTPNASINVALIAGNASTINTSTLAHTHTVNITQIIFIIKVV